MTGPTCGVVITAAGVAGNASASSGRVMNRRRVARWPAVAVSQDTTKSDGERADLVLLVADPLGDPGDIGAIGGQETPCTRRPRPHIAASVSATVPAWRAWPRQRRSRVCQVLDNATAVPQFGR